MIINKRNQVFIYNGVEYKIGQNIIARSESDYAGLFGTITEIRDGKDKETENVTPDIYCAFDKPILPCKISETEKRFSKLYGGAKKIDDIPLDCVILSPEEIKIFTETSNNNIKGKVYVVEEEWTANCDSGSSMSDAYTDIDDAMFYLSQKLSEEMESGCIAGWKDDEEFAEDSNEISYVAYIDGFYSENHYSIGVYTLNIV